MPGASPMVDDLDVVRRLEDAGAAAIVMHSLFETLTVVLEDIDAYLLVTALGDIARARGRSETAKPWGLPARMNRT